MTDRNIALASGFLVLFMGAARVAQVTGLGLSIVRQLVERHGKCDEQAWRGQYF